METLNMWSKEVLMQKRQQIKQPIIKEITETLSDQINNSDIVKNKGCCPSRQY